MGLLNTKFTTSWLGYVFNPVGAMAQRQSVSEAADDYLLANPPDLSGLTGELSQQTYRQSYINGCAAQLKSDDVGKSRANCVAGCTEAFDRSPEVAAAVNAAAQAAAKDNLQLQADNRKLLGMAAFAIVLIILILIILKS